MSQVIDAPMEHQKFVKGYKYRLYPTPRQAQVLNQYLGAARYIYNRLLADSIDVYNNWKENPSLPKPTVSGYDFVIAVKNLKIHTNTPWLGAIPSIILQQKALDLGSAFTNFFKKTHKNQGYPRFKKKGYNDSFRVVGEGSIHVIPEGVTIPKTNSPIRVGWSRDLPSAPSSYTVTRTPTGKYFVSFVCEYIPNRPSGTGKVGIDLGIKNTAYLSTGESIPNPKPFIGAQKHLVHLQRQLAKCILGSRNFHKLRIKIAKIHEYICNFRLDFIHKLTSRLISENQAICLERLSVSSMVKNHRLAKHILDAAFGLISRLFVYKAQESTNTRIFLADPWYPSTQLCSHCGGLPSVKIPLSTRQWTCEHCGSVHQRDFNASKNLEHLIDEMSPRLEVEPTESRVILVPKFSV